MAKKDIYSDIGTVFELDAKQVATLRKGGKKVAKFVGEATDVAIDVGSRVFGATIAAAGAFVTEFGRRK